jgi:hypothetical protein
MAVKRREFIRVAGAMAAVAGTIPSLVFGAVSGKSRDPIESYLLKGFDKEQEEYPSLVSNKKGEMWMFSLRRLAYPRGTEIISAFRYAGDRWIETEPVTRTEGRYESPVAACAPDGNPLVAWCSIESGHWNINVANFGADGGKEFHRFRSASGKPINPVLFASAATRAWIAWENYHQGRFSIFISRMGNGRWSDPFEISKGESSCFDPALADNNRGELYVAYSLTDGYHQNIEMAVFDSRTLQRKKTVPVAVGGGFADRVNLNTRPALAFDSLDRLWISYENNRNSTRLEDGDNYTGDRCCAILSYQDGEIVEPAATGKWLFTGKNDHRPTFFHDREGKLYLATHCGGDFEGRPYWEYRISRLDAARGWTKPETLLESTQKGVMIPPACACDLDNNLWFSTLEEKIFDHEKPGDRDQAIRSRLTQLKVFRFSETISGASEASLKFTPTRVVEYHRNDDFIPEVSGHPKVSGEKITADGQEYTLVYGNLHEHTENSSCWPAGTDGTLHQNYRFGIYTENYDFMGITDHGYTMNEVYWRKNNRLADFYHDPPYFAAVPAMEWTLSARGNLESVFGAGHYNILFASPEEAGKFVRNRDEIFNVNTPESTNPVLLWELLRKKQIDCITIPHHPADSYHPVDWNVHDAEFVPVVEMFQCRGNAEYPGCPRELNVTRHHPTESRRAFVDYALREKKYKMGFIASGDHNSMGVGVACLWVKEFSRDGLLEAMRNRRCFATTGDKMILDFRLDGSLQGSTVKVSGAPALSIKVRGQRALDKIEVLRDSRVIKEFGVPGENLDFDAVFMDSNYPAGNDVCYYYIRATQKNNEMAWSSPIWVENA